MKFCLVDDNVESVNEIVNTACRRLWTKVDDLELTIVFFGDDYKRVPTARDATDEEIQKIKDDIEKKLQDLCFYLDRDEWEPLGTTYERKKQEHTEITCQRYPVQQEELSAWRTVKKPEKDSSKDIDYSILHKDPLPKKMAEWFCAQQCRLIALDVCLLYDDYERCMHKLPVLSMALHYYLEHECRCKCFLYSRMSMNTDAKSNWTEVYRQQFDTEPPVIHSRFSLGADVSRDYQELESLLLST